MTQDTQTTGERLLAIIGMNYRIIQHGDTRIADHSKAAEIIAAEIDALAAERDEARGIIANGREQRRLDVMTIAAQADVIDERNTQLAEARAEAERLRPAAEAWEAREGLIATSSAWRDASPDDEIRTYQAMQTADEKLAQAAARARAAKETP